MMKHQKNGDTIKVFLPGEIETIIDIGDEWLLDLFPTWGTTKGHVWVSRWIETEFGSLSQRIYVHRAIMIRALGLEGVRVWQIDHKDRNKLNNQRSNLRLASASQNSANCVRPTQSGYRGVSVDKSRPGLKKKYRAYIRNPETKKAVMLGYFENPVEAAKCYDKAAKERWGDFAVLNFPEAQT